MPKFDKDILLSVKVPHARRILTGIKPFEFRRGRVRASEGMRAWIYETLPSGVISGSFVISQIHYLPVEMLLALEPDRTARRTLVQYLGGASRGTALGVADPITLLPERHLGDFGLTRPPQSYVFVPAKGHRARPEGTR